MACFAKASKFEDELDSAELSPEKTNRLTTRKQW
jgi:hypothetical protein